MKTVLAVLVTCSVTALCQPGPAFEVASIRPHVFARGTYGFTFGSAKPLIGGNRVRLEFVNLISLMMFAYDVTEKQISIPAEIKTARNILDISAVTPGDVEPSVDQVRLMVRALLADRFQLKIRHESQVLSVFNLTVGKNGSKLKPSRDTSQPSIKNEGAPAEGATLTLQDAPRDMRVVYTHQPIAEVVRLLTAAQTSRIVVDKTGLIGTYDFALSYTVEMADRTGSAQIAAVQEQLGLKLDPAEEPLDVLVVESVQAPSEN